MPRSDSEKTITHVGKCHCGSIKYVYDPSSIAYRQQPHSPSLLDDRFQFTAPADLAALDCNCSICSMKRNTHIIIPQHDLTMLEGESKLSEYKFNTNTARHLFCSTCGICPFYVPRSNPDSYAVTLYCIEPGTINSVRINSFDGANWDKPARPTQESMIFC